MKDWQFYFICGLLFLLLARQAHSENNDFVFATATIAIGFCIGAVIIHIKK